jgi:hypothetical protein
MTRIVKVIIDLDVSSSLHVDNIIQELNQEVFNNQIHHIETKIIGEHTHIRIHIKIPKFISYHILISFLRAGIVTLKTKNNNYKAIIYSPSSTAPSF